MAKKKRANSEVERLSPKGVVNPESNASQAVRRFLSDPFQHRSWLMDPYSATLQMGRPSRPSLLSYDIMRSMAVRSPTIRSIINLRKAQMSAFTRRPLFRGDRGFRVVLKDSKAEMNAKDRKLSYMLEEFILNTGWEKSHHRPTFNVYMRKLLEDSLSFDNAATELVYDRVNRLSQFWAVDGATIEIVIPDMWTPQTPLGQESDEPIQFIQDINGQVVAEYTVDEMMLTIRNPQTSIAYYGYGISELETLVQEITTELFVMQWSQTVLSQGSIPDGLIIFKGNGFDEETLEDFQRVYRNLASGVQAAGRLQALSIGPTESVELIETHDKPNEMAFSELLELTRTQICDVYGVDVNELNAWRHSGSGSLIDSDATKTRIEFSIDKGLVPLMKFFADDLTRNVIDRVDDRFKFEWVGLNQDEEYKQLKIQIQRLEAGLATPNIILAERGEPLIEAKWANAPLQQQLFQAWLMENQGGEGAVVGDDNKDTPKDGNKPQSAEEDLSGGAKQSHEHPKEAPNVFGKTADMGQARDRESPKGKVSGVQVPLGGK